MGEKSVAARGIVKVEENIAQVRIIQLFSEESFSEEDKAEQEEGSKYPIVEIGFGPNTEIALLDTGAQVSAIAKRKLDTIKTRVSIRQLPTPKTNIR